MRSGAPVQWAALRHTAEPSSAQVRESLLNQVQRRLIVVGAVAAAFVGALLWLAWTYGVNLYTERIVTHVREHYVARLTDFSRAQQGSARRLRAQIEFLRLGELDDAARRLQLQAFFTAQGEDRDFDAVLIADARGMPLFNLGCEALLLDAYGRRQTNDPIFVPDRLSDCDVGDAVYILAQTPIWLGRQGKGTALFATSLDNARLRALAQSDDELFLQLRGRTLAASGGNSHLAERLTVPAAGWVRRDGHVLFSVPLQSQTMADTPLLVVRRPMALLISDQYLLVGVSLASLLMLALLWLGLGRTIRRHLWRLALLGAGADAFIQRFHRDADWHARLDQVCVRSDELAQLGRALDALMGEAERRHQEQRAYLQTLDLLADVVIELDQEARLLNVSNAWTQLMCEEPSRAIGRAFADYVEPQDVPALQTTISALKHGAQSQTSVRLRLKRADNGQIWSEVRLASAGDGQTLRGLLRDITQSYLQEQRMTHMALHDALTGLPNRVLLEDRLKIALRLAQRSGNKVALGFIDLDHFKNVNDNLGHKLGDALLVAVAQRLRQVMRAGDTLARWGGDEFVALLTALPNHQATLEAAMRLRAAAETPLQVQGNEFNITFSIGFAVYPDDAREIDELMAYADRAMFYAKAQGRNAMQFYSDMAKRGLGRQEANIQQRLVAATREGRIVNHYQPIVDAETGHVVGVETLARWHEPDLGWVSPATFIPMAENQGIIGELGEQVLRNALRDGKGWWPRGIGLSVNISKRQLFKPDFTSTLLSVLANHGLPAHWVTLEITESMAVQEVEHGAERLHELREAGFRLAIDDFGTGYSSLSQLHDLPVHELKIDQSFVRRIHLPSGARIVQTIVGLARNFGLEAVAEGVETAEAAETLIQMGVDRLQGWHYARPMSAEDFMTWLDGRG